MTTELFLSPPRKMKDGVLRQDIAKYVLQDCCVTKKGEPGMNRLDTLKSELRVEIEYENEDKH
jgi:hypothetical protein